jgi:hypothetical protein
MCLVLQVIVREAYYISQGNRIVQRRNTVVMQSTLDSYIWRIKRWQIDTLEQTYELERTCPSQTQ